MENKHEMTEIMTPDAILEVPEENSLAVSSKNPNRFKKGESGNPSGRRKLTDEEKDVLKEIKKLGPRTVEVMEEMLNSRIAAIAKVRLIEIILDRILGKPEAHVKLESNPQSVETAEAKIEAMIKSIRIVSPSGGNENE